MAQTRPSYTYNPDLPTRRWHQKWINPLITLQNAPPASHGIPAPTKEDGEVGHAGFKVRPWIPMDEDVDITEDQLQQEVEWWTKPGAPLRPELRTKVEIAAAAAASIPQVVNVEEPMQIDSVGMSVDTIEMSENDSVPTAPTSDPNESLSIGERMVPEEPLRPQQADSEVQDHIPSPMQSSAIPVSPSLSQALLSPKILPSEAVAPQSQRIHSPPAPSPPGEQIALDEILAASKESTPPSPIAQAKEVAPGLELETPAEHAKHAADPGLLSGVGGGIAGEGIVGSGSTDLGDMIDITESHESQKPTSEEEENILEASKQDLDTEIIASDAGV